MKYVFGIEGGGTKTTGVIANLKGKILATETGGPSNFLIIGIEKACENIMSVFDYLAKKIETNPDEIECAFFGLTGAGRFNDQENMKNGFLKYTNTKNYNFKKVVVDSDARISLEGAFPDKPGMILISGTGSILFGKDSGGSLFRVGGWGRIIGDEGSGLYIGKKGLTIVAQTIDGRKNDTLLAKLFSEKYNLNSLESIVSAVYRENFDLAVLAPLVLEAAENGDNEANNIINEAVNDLFLHIKTMANKINSKEKIGLAFDGSLLSNNTIVRQNLVKRIEQELSSIQICERECSSVEGAVLLALKNL
jgi:N-acetylglucosamine kinase-like BadF-type ATPase